MQSPTPFIVSVLIPRDKSQKHSHLFLLLLLLPFSSSSSPGKEIKRPFFHWSNTRCLHSSYFFCFVFLIFFFTSFSSSAYMFLAHPFPVFEITDAMGKDPRSIIQAAVLFVCLSVCCLFCYVCFGLVDILYFFVLVLCFSLLCMLLFCFVVVVLFLPPLRPFKSFATLPN